MEKKFFSHRGRHTGKERGNLLKDIFSDNVRSLGNVEVDIRKTRDGKFVLFHDDGIVHNDLSYRICDHDHSELSLIAGENSFTIDTLEDLLSQTSLFIDFEIKEQGYEIELVSMILERMSQDNFIVTSFHWDVIRNIRKEFPQIRTGILFETEQELEEFLKLCNNDDDFFDYILPSLVLYRKIPEELKKRDNFIIWTVNDIHDIEDLKKDPFIYGIISDHIFL